MIDRSVSLVESGDAQLSRGNIAYTKPKTSTSVDQCTSEASTSGKLPNVPNSTSVSQRKLATVQKTNQDALADALLSDKHERAPSQSTPPMENAVSSSSFAKQHSKPNSTDVKKRRCCRCKIQCCRLPRWLSKLLTSIYTNTGGAITYGLLLLAIYTSCFSLMPEVAKLPVCRRFTYPDPDAGRVDVKVPAMTKSVPHHLTGLECRNGEAVSVLLFYGFGFLLGELMELLHLPGLLGMLLGGLTLRNIGIQIINETIYHEGQRPNGSQLVGALIGDGDGPFDIRDSKTQFAALLDVNPSISGILRQLALAAILTRAGLGLDPSTLKEVFGSVFRLAFLPCFCEALCIMVVTRFLIGWPWVWGAILGFVCAAVSPAVIVPNMMRLEVTGWGVAEGIPTLVVAAASLDDVIAITGFGVALAMALTTEHSLIETVILGPTEALIGITFGAIVGFVLCIFPPPKLEHSHLLRGILLICLAVTALLGSIVMQLPGAGALACLTLAFTVATGWRAGFPWRLVEEEIIVDEQQAPDPKEQETFDKIPVLSRDGQQGVQSTSFNETQLSDVEEQSETSDGLVSSTRRHSRKKSCESNILETLVEYHPHYCAILRQEYRRSMQKEAVSPRSFHSSFHKKFAKVAHGGDLPALAVAVAATGSERKASYQAATPQVARRTRLRASRRFSLPEPTAHYETESFSVSGPSRRLLSPRSGSTIVQNLYRKRGRPISPTIHEQYEGLYGKQADKLDQIEENAFDRGDPLNSTEHEEEDQMITDESEDRAFLFPVPATPRERGLACVNSMRQTLAAVWWFVQPILFSLIGSEVNLSNMAGQSVGRGVVCLLIALVFRLAVTVLAVLPSKLNMKECLFVAFSWLPKATVQAAVGPVALDTARKLNASAEIQEYAEQVLTLAALAILLTAPLGAILMPLTAPYLLRQDKQTTQLITKQVRSGTDPVSESTEHSRPKEPASNL